ncbi:MAG: hypothetical protein ACI4OP_08460 [Candidatus Coprovivens sp.]
MYLEALCTLYELQQNRILASKSKLNELGVTDEQIQGMLDNDLIYQNDSSAYLLSPVKKLFVFGYNNLLLGNKRTALGIFELCYKIKPKHRDTCLQLFYHAVNTHNYPAAYEYLYALENVSTNEHLRKDYKIYLYLLSQVSEVPPIYQEKLENIKQDKSLMIHKKPDKHQRQENEVVSLILKSKYKFAIERLNDFISEDHDYTVHRVIIKSLLRGIIGKHDKYKHELLDKVKKKRYREIVAMLEATELERELRSDEFNILIIVRAIIEIFENGTLPTIIPIEAETVSEAVACYDFEKALELENNFLLINNLPSDQSHMYLLLLQITQLMKNVTRLEDNGIPIDNQDTTTL